VAAEDEVAEFRRFLGRLWKASRSYAVEQMNWFHRDPGYLWLRLDFGAKD
jgi:tRNA A37 N6-isopentenylltransferase MiaA